MSKVNTTRKRQRAMQARDAAAAEPSDRACRDNRVYR